MYRHTSDRVLLKIISLLHLLCETLVKLDPILVRAVASVPCVFNISYVYGCLASVQFDRSIFQTTSQALEYSLARLVEISVSFLKPLLCLKIRFNAENI